VAAPVKGDEATHPLQVALFGLITQMSYAHLLARDFEQPTSLWQCHVAKLTDALREHLMRTD
jgi:hypothetical protein